MRVQLRISIAIVAWLAVACGARAQPASQRRRVPPQSADQTEVAPREPPVDRRPRVATAVSQTDAAAAGAAVATSARGSQPQHASDEDRIRDVIREDYEEGLGWLQRDDPGEAGKYFGAASANARGLGNGRGLFQQRPDGYWAYRQDDISYYYALAEYRMAVLVAAATTDEGHGRWAEELFCQAFRECPDAVLDAAKKEKFSPTIQRIFDRARSRCSAKDSCAHRGMAEYDAINAYRYAMVYAQGAFSARPTAEAKRIAAEDERARVDAEQRFCEAIRARPDVVLVVAAKEGLPREAKRIFDTAKRKCHVNGGWRSATEEQPRLGTDADIDALFQ